MLNRLFVYGTLQRGQKAHKVLKSADAKFVSNGKVRGVLHDLGDYPGLLANGNPDSFVPGEVYELSKPETALCILDGYEEFDPLNARYSLFVRKRSHVYLSDGSRILAWVYFYNRPVSRAPVSAGTRSNQSRG